MRTGRTRRTRLTAVICAAALIAVLGVTAGGSLAADPDVTFTVTEAPEPVTAGLNARYVFDVTNPTTSATFYNLFTNTVPAGATLVSVTASQSTCSVSGASISCQLGKINAGAAASVTILLTAPTTDFTSCGTL